MLQRHEERDDGCVEVLNASAKGDLVLVCEHASNHVPGEFGSLGLDRAALASHIAWDPGARGLAMRMAERLDAVLVAGTVSRLVYDFNRPPEARDAIPERSERTDVPGNTGLDAAARAARGARFHAPFHAAVAARLAPRAAPVLVTVHSFTPVYDGVARDVEIGVLHDADSRLADALLARRDAMDGADIRRNEPYGPGDGVTHTLRRHALPQGHLNVMLEVRNDLIDTAARQNAMGDALSRWLADALAAPEARA